MWEERDNSLYRKFEFKDFKAAFDFMQKVAKAAEEHKHHPKWLNEYNKVEIWFSSHDAGNKITDKDHILAAVIDRIYENAEI